MKNFLTIGTRDRLRFVIFVLLFVAPVLLWPIFFCAKMDGETSSSWVALWTPLWIHNALGEEEALGRGDIRNEKVDMGGGGKVEPHVLLTLVRCQTLFSGYERLLFVFCHVVLPYLMLTFCCGPETGQGLWASFVFWGTILTVT